MGVPVHISPSDRAGLLARDEEGRRLARLSLWMVAASVGAFVVAAVILTVLHAFVFDLAEQESLREAGAWGVVAGLAAMALAVVPAVVGVVLGVRAHRLGEGRLATTGIAVNALFVAYVGVTTIAGPLFLG